jgi:dihydrofolate reductase
MQTESAGQGCRLVIVVAVAENGVIGRDGALPWRVPSDLKTFRRLTLGKPVIMGRKTFQSLGKPLDGRDNIVVTRDADFNAAGVRTAPTLAAAIALAAEAAHARHASEIAVIGGGEIYRAAIDQAEKIYLTRIHAAPSGDATFPPLDPAVWKVVSESPIEPSERDEHRATLVVYERRALPDDCARPA